MYSTNNNAQAIESREKIRDALLTLMKQYSYDEISITQICHEAQIVRQTYYRNFDCKGDILSYHFDCMFQHYLSVYHKEENSREDLSNFFKYMLQCRDFLNLIFDNSIFFIIARTIVELVPKYLKSRKKALICEPEHEKYLIGFITSTICSLLYMWVKDGFVESTEVMTDLAYRFLGGLI